MKRHLTRRAVTKLLFAAPAAALAAGPLACQASSGSGHSVPKRSSAEKEHQEDLARTTSHLEKSAKGLASVDVPIGSDPAVAFAPLLATK